MDGGDEFSGEDNRVVENMSSRMSLSRRVVRSTGSSLDGEGRGRKVLGLVLVLAMVGWSTAAGPATRLPSEVVKEGRGEANFAVFVTFRSAPGL